ncbi:MAG: tripartite tricarboxylate transporter TctB family protein [Planctomycetes bacterium]|nr:tripartite tricarboxylate transporter TctB family protein [Planctomycetota bacterium]
MRKNETLILVALICFSIGCIKSMLGGSSIVLRDEILPANLYSNVLAGFLIFVCIIRLVVLYGKNAVADDDKKIILFTPTAFLIAACSIIYAIGITSIGFYISSFICLLALFLGFENWNRAKIGTGLIFSIGLCIIFYVTFSYMKIYLPDAIFF